MNGQPALSGYSAAGTAAERLKRDVGTDNNRNEMDGRGFGQRTARRQAESKGQRGERANRVQTASGALRRCEIEAWKLNVTRVENQTSQPEGAVYVLPGAARRN